MKMKNIFVIILFIFLCAFTVFADNDIRYINSNNINLRRDASTRYIAFGKLLYGTKVFLTGNTEEDWAEINVPKEKIKNLDEITKNKYITGWLLDKFLSEELPKRELSEEFMNRLNSKLTGLKSEKWKVRYKSLEFIKRNISLLRFSTEEGTIIKTVIPFLGDSVFYDRKIASQILSGFGEIILPHIDSSLKSNNWHVRYNVLETLSDFTSDDAKKIVINFFYDIHPKIKTKAGEIFANYNNLDNEIISYIDSYFKNIIESIKHNSEVLADFFTGLSKCNFDIEDKKEYFEQFLAYPNSKVKISLMNLIAANGNKKYLNFLRVAMLDENFKVREAAGAAINKIQE